MEAGAGSKHEATQRRTMEAGDKMGEGTGSEMGERLAEVKWEESKERDKVEEP